MAVASRSVRSSGFSFKGVLFTGIGIALIVALFFIPEIIQFQRSGSGTDSQKSASGMKTLQTAAVSIPKDPKDSQLNRIASLIDSGYLDRMGSKPAPESKPGDPKAANANSKTEGKAANQKETGISWKGLKSKDSRMAMKRAHDEILNILRSLPADRKGSRFALLNFANGLEQVVDGGMDKTVPAPEALAQLENLHSACIKEFLREGVDQVSYKRFVAVSFGPAISKYSIKLSGQLVPFNPQLTLINLDMSSRRGKDANAPVMVAFEGFVVGDDVDRIEMVSGGIRFDDIIPRKVESSGYRKFKTKRFELTGKVLLKVFDNRGRVYQKLYSFYPRARIFESRNGRFMIPKTVSEYDNRLDRFFTYQVSKPSEVSDRFFESQGFEKF